MPVTPQDAAAEFLRIIPLVMRIMAADIRETHPDINPANFGLLSILSKRTWSLSELANKQMVSNPTMSKTITTLEERGWVQRQRSREDRRKVEITITRQGQKILNSVHRQMVERITQELEGLSAAQREQLNAGLNILHDVFSNATYGEEI